MRSGTCRRNARCHAITVNTSTFTKEGVRSICVPRKIGKVKPGTFHQYQELLSLRLPRDIRGVNSCDFRVLNRVEDLQLSNGVGMVPGGTFMYYSDLGVLGVPRNIRILKLSYFTVGGSLRRIILPSAVAAVDHNIF